MRLHLLLILFFVGSFVAGARITRQTTLPLPEVSVQAGTDDDDGGYEISLCDLPMLFINLIKAIPCFIIHMICCFLKLITLPERLALGAASIPIKIMITAIKLALKIFFPFLPVSL